MSLESHRDLPSLKTLIGSARVEGADSDSARLLYNDLLPVLKGRLPDPDLVALRVIEGLEWFPCDGQYRDDDFIRWAIEFGQRNPQTVPHSRRRNGEIPLSAFAGAPYYPRLLDGFGLTAQDVTLTPYTAPASIVNFLQERNLSFQDTQIGSRGGIKNAVAKAFEGDKGIQSDLFYYLVAGISPVLDFGQDPYLSARTHLLAARCMEDLPYLHGRFINHKMLPSDLWKHVFKRATFGENPNLQTTAIDYKKPLHQRIVNTFSSSEKRQQALELALSGVELDEIARLVKYSPKSIQTIFTNMRDGVEAQWFNKAGFVRVASLGEQALTIAASAGRLMAFNFLGIWYTTLPFADYYNKHHRVKVDQELLDSGFVLVSAALGGSSWLEPYRVRRNRRVYLPTEVFTRGQEMRALREEPLTEGMDVLASYTRHPSYSALIKALKESRIPGANYQEMPFHGHKGRWIFPKAEADKYLQGIGAKKSKKQEGFLIFNNLHV